MKPLELNQWLIQMHQKGMVHYKPEDNNCGLLFLVDRIDKRYFKLSKSFIDAWITSKRERSKAILDFLQSEECLHITISNYFGQDEQQPCGRCSNCTIDHYPDQDKVASMLKEGFQIDDIWLDLNCSPDALKRN
jgi:ATP-dependent DNA helicase RecQ